MELKMSEKRKPGRPKAEPTKPALIRLTEPQRVKFLELGGARWVKRLLNEAMDKIPRGDK